MTIAPESDAEHMPVAAEKRRQMLDIGDLQIEPFRQTLLLFTVTFSLPGEFDIRVDHALAFHIGRQWR